MGSASAVSRSDMTLLCPADIFSARNLCCPTARIAHTTTASRTRSRRGDRRTCIEGLLPEGAHSSPRSAAITTATAVAVRSHAESRRTSTPKTRRMLFPCPGGRSPTSHGRFVSKPTSRYAANKKPAAIVRTDTVPSQSVRRFPFPNRGIASSSFQSSCFVG